MSQTLLTIPEACAALRISRAMLYRLFSTGKLPKVTIGTRAFVAPADIDTFIVEHRSTRSLPDNRPDDVLPPESKVLFGTEDREQTVRDSSGAVKHGKTAGPPKLSSASAGQNCTPTAPSKLRGAPRSKEKAPRSKPVPKVGLTVPLVGHRP